MDAGRTFATAGDTAQAARVYERVIKEFKSQSAAAANLDFEKAASLRDDIKRLRTADLGLPWPARRT